MYTLFIVLICIASVLMIGIVLIQESKGGGLASNFSSANSIMGVRQTTDFVEKATWGLAAAMVIFSVVCSYTAPQAPTDQSVLENQAVKTQTTAPTNTQGFGAGQPAQGQQGQQAAPAQGQPAQGAAAPAQGQPTQGAAAPAAPAQGAAPAPAPQPDH